MMSALDQAVPMTDERDKQMVDKKGTNKARRHGMQSSCPTIGLLTDEGMRPLNRALWAGIDAILQERGANFIRFPGGPLHSPVGFQAQANVLYDLITAENVDGLVIWGAVLARNVSLEEMKSFLERYRPLPMVSIGLSLEGVPSVLPDNYGGMWDAVLHLIEVHGCRRIAYIRGPEGHPEADERYRAYRDVLSERGLPFDPELVAPGSFDAVGAVRAGAAAISLLLDKRKVDFEAIVAANDNMALSALAALQARGVRVPDDVAVVGFNDQEGSGYVMPPLTTVSLPIQEQGRQAAEMVLALLAGEEIPEQVVLPAKVVVRQSCGCADPGVMRAAVGPVTATGKLFETAFATRRGEVLSEIVQAVRSPSMGVISEQAEQLLDAFSAELKGESAGIFLSTLGETLRQVAAANGDVAAWQEAISTLRRHALPCLADAGSLSRAEDLWHQARVVIAGTVQRVEAHQRLQEEREAETLREIAQELSTTFDVAGLMEVLARELPRLGIPRGYLSLYEDPQAPTEWSRLILAYDEKGRLELPPEGWRFPSRQLLPTGLLPEERRYRMVVAPLYFRETQLGFALFEVGQREERICEALRVQISSALQGASLFKHAESRAAKIQIAAEVSRVVSSILKPKELMQQIVELIRARFDLYYVGLFLVQEGRRFAPAPRKWAVLRAGTGEAGRQMLEQGHKLEVGGTSMIGRCIADGKAYIAQDVGEEAVRFDNPLLPETRSEMALPLISREEVIGALTIQSSQKAAFTQEDVAILETMAAQLANAIENARLFIELETALEELKAAQRYYIRQAWSDYLKRRG